MAEGNRTTFILLGGAFIVAAGLVYAAFATDAKTDAVTAEPALDAGGLLAELSVLGQARLLPPAGADQRVEITLSRNPDLMPDDLGAMSLTSPFVIGQMRTGTSHQKVEGGLERVSIRHRILPAVAWFHDEAAKKNRAWVGALMQWELDVTQREILAMYPDASIPEGGIPMPPVLTITGPAVRYPDAVKQLPELGTPAAKKFICMGEDTCDDTVLAKVLVVIVD